MLQLVQQLKTSAAAVQCRWSASPQAAIILGSGLGDLADAMVVEQSIDYTEIPHLPAVSVPGHRGKLVCGHIDGVPVVAYQGRFHLYEGHSPQQATFSVRLARELGAESLLIFNATGGLNPAYSVGDLMLIEDQINFMFANPLVGINDESLGPRFPDMSRPFDIELNELAAEVARKEKFVLHRGIYTSMLGPTYETRAEYRMLRRLGGDAVGMSTVPEVLVARHAGMRVLGVSTITNVGLPDALCETTGHGVLEAAGKATERLTKIMHGVIAGLAS